MIKIISIFSVYFSLAASLFAGEIKIASYNCGGLPEHYDYLRAAVMQKVMREREAAEPLEMSLNEKIQQIAAQILFAKGDARASALQEWEAEGYASIVEHLMQSPTDPTSPHSPWFAQTNAAISSYKTRPVTIFDEEVAENLQAYLNHFSTEIESFQEQLTRVRQLMAAKTLAEDLPYDILCLQESNYLDSSLFPESFSLQFGQGDHLKTGIAWNKNRFELIEQQDLLNGKAFIVHLLDKESGQTFWVASAHLTGSNPYRVEIDPQTGLPDSTKGDAELQALLAFLDEQEGEAKIIGMDANVTALHPRLKLLRQADYQVDGENAWEATCTNPHFVMHTRIDWITVKAKQAAITNLPVSNIELNSPETNISDHKPIAAQISID